MKLTCINVTPNGPHAHVTLRSEDSVQHLTIRYHADNLKMFEVGAEYRFSWTKLSAPAPVKGAKNDEGKGAA